MARSNRIINRAVGMGGENDRNDVISAKRTLNQLGLYAPPPEGIGDDIDADFDRGVRMFQAKNGLKVDGLIEPGGETERNLLVHAGKTEFERAPSLAVVLGNGVGYGGENDTADVTTIKRLFGALDRYRYDRTRPPPPYIDTKLVETIRSFQRDNGLFDDGLIEPEGETLPALREAVAAQQASQGRGEDRGERQFESERVAFAPAALIPPAIAGIRALAPHAARILGITGGAVAGQKVIDAARKKQVADPPQSIPPYPADPPVFDDGLEVYPADPARPEDAVETYPADAPVIPAYTEFPIPDDLGVLIEVYPNQSGEIDWPIIVENSRGNDDTQKENTDIARIGTEIIEEDKLSGEHTHGGDNVYGNYKKELYMPNSKTGKRLDSSRPDIVFRSRKTGRSLFINTVDTNAKGEELTTREYNAGIRILGNARSGDILVTAPKGKGKSFNLEAFKEFLRPLLQEIDRPAPKIDPRSKVAAGELIRRWFPPKK